MPNLSVYQFLFEQRSAWSSLTCYLSHNGSPSLVLSFMCCEPKWWWQIWPNGEFRVSAAEIVPMGLLMFV